MIKGKRIRKFESAAERRARIAGRTGAKPTAADVLAGFGSYRGAIERFEVRLPDGTVRDAVAVIVTGGAS